MISEDDMKKIDVNIIKSVNVSKGNIKKEIKIITKNSSGLPEDAEIYIDGKKATKEELDKIEKEEIETININNNNGKKSIEIHKKNIKTISGGTWTDVNKEIKKQIEPKFVAYRKMYAEYYEKCKRDNSPAIRDANPVVILYPGVGMFTFAKDKQTARVAGEFYINAINVMKGAEAISSYTSLPLQEAFNIEYWLLEEAKLQRMPKPKALKGKIPSPKLASVEGQITMLALEVKIISISLAVI